MLRIAHKHGVKASEPAKDTEQDLIDAWKAEFVRKHNSRFSSGENQRAKSTSVQALQRRQA